MIKLRFITDITASRIPVLKLHTNSYGSVLKLQRSCVTDLEPFCLWAIRVNPLITVISKKRLLHSFWHVSGSNVRQRLNNRT